MNTKTTATRFGIWRVPAAFGLSLALFLTACASSSDDESKTSEEASTSDETVQSATDDNETSSVADQPVVEADDRATPASSLDINLFFEGALAEAATIEDCTLSGGAETKCYRITVSGSPSTHEIGPFCPTSITDGADAGGLWWDGEAMYDLDGQFVTGLPDIYDDDGWQMYDEDGNVFVTETAEEFDLAARPNVDPSVQNHCVEGRLEWLDSGEAIPSTVLIPVEPVPADGASAPQGNQGVTLDGVVIAASAPVDAILGAYTIAAFDDCGGHINPVDGYHLHGAVGCSELDEVADGETPMFGYAMDGYPVHSPIGGAANAELDECNGHATDAEGYHYHANSAEQNQVIECLIGQTVAGANDRGRGRPDGPRPEDDN